MSQEQILEQVLLLLEQQGLAAAGNLKQQLQARGAELPEQTSEELLLRDALDFHGRQISEWRERITQDEALTSSQKLLMRYTLLEEHVRRGRFPGCLFIAACSIYPAPHHPIHQVAEQQKQASWQYTHRQLTALELDNPTMVTDQLELVLEGCLSKLLVKRNLQDIATARRLAEDILQVALCRQNGALS
ncbi:MULTISPECIES: transcriptional regulator [Tatumella]|uniref:Transcriptional regulator n=1 Tax=Tatumella punctata TaxID=399969 RepID=A0ABW1VJG6_9GAMM|nr:transcriptional regulator [Tatumella sp. JGM16]MBS0877150.1 transcriptional regulator [Tatumella sp. JGM82]MBS0890582.1 transcriptional regulator [Tatumella sp. JGM94]MBS0893255.1 transcriptional regulator [Tatumella sp. JGM130]MBS0901453.1 transcriptional regulator [Tatumella sp. JGM100]MBS0912255.1 transcriptional regulator [Tatumella sp. JGM91]